MGLFAPFPPGVPSGVYAALRSAMQSCPVVANQFFAGATEAAELLARPQKAEPVRRAGQTTSFRAALCRSSDHNFFAPKLREGRKILWITRTEVGDRMLPTAPMGILWGCFAQVIHGFSTSENFIPTILFAFVVVRSRSSLVVPGRSYPQDPQPLLLRLRIQKEQKGRRILGITRQRDEL